MTLRLPFTLRPSSAAIAFALSVLAGASAAAPPVTPPAADSAWATDPQQTWVSDRASEPIQSVNSVMCFIASMAPGRLVGAGPYLALVDKNACDGGRNDSSGNTGADYQRAVLDVTRLDNASPMRGRVWVEQDAGGTTIDIHANMTVTEAPSATNANGVFTLDYCAPMPGGGCFLNGKLEGLANGLRFIEREPRNGGRAMVRLAVNRDGDTGSGAVAQDPGDGSGVLTYRFAYDTSVFRRVRVGGEDACFDRSLSRGVSAAFRYGLYDQTGARVARNGGFPVTAELDGRRVQGFAGYWGLSFPPEVDARLVDGTTVTKLEFGSQGAGTGASYTLARVPGRLTQYTRREMGLSQAKGVPLQMGFWNGLSAPTMTTLGIDLNTLRRRQLQLTWNDGASRLEVTGIVDCSGAGGCQTQAVTPVVPLTAADLQPYAGGLTGWSQGLGGEVGLPAATIAALIAAAPDAGARPVTLRLSEVVYPGTAGAPTSLHCVADCPSAEGIASLASGGLTPYGTTQGAWRPSTAVDYAFAPDGRLRLDGVPVLWPADQAATGAWGNGVRSGRLVADLEALRCADDPTKFCGDRANDQDVFYVWETGLNPWNQFAGLKGADAAWVRFDAPLQVSWTAPDRPEFGAFAGATMQLQYNDFGDLWGIPSTCVDSVTNARVACGPGETIRWMPSLTIPDSLTEGRVVDAQGTVYYAKWLNREVRFRKLPDAACAALTPGSVADLPAVTVLRNPADPAQTDVYIGTKPDLSSAAPRVIGGVVKY